MSTPHLLLFGSPGAGKSSLLGALAQAAVMETPTLKGKLVDKSKKLDRLHKSTYNGNTEPTPKLEEFEIRMEPAEGHTATAEATLLDCSGVDALEMLQSKAPFAGANPMKEPLLEADAVLLLIDASLPTKQLYEQFQQFGRWLKEFHAVRGERVDVGALPVYLVLTKCDQLAKKEDTFAQWMQRIEEGKRRIDERFQEMLKEQGHAFGSIELRIWATSIKRPQLADRPAKPQEPFMVAELFRESLHAASDFQERRRASHYRLQNVMVALIALVAMLGLALVGLTQYQPDTSWATLDERVQQVLPRSDSPAVRLGSTLKKLEEKRKTLGEIQQDPAFGRLPGESQKAVNEYWHDIDQYLKLTDGMKARVKPPFVAKIEEDFIAQEKDASAFKYPTEWDETPLGKRIQLVRNEYERVREEVKKEEAWLKAETEACEKLLDEGTELLSKLRRKLKLAPQEAELWEAKCVAHLQRKSRAPRMAFIPEVTGMTYEFLDKFQSVKAARKRWETKKDELRSLEKLIKAFSERG